MQLLPQIIVMFQFNKPTMHVMISRKRNRWTAKVW